jgi:hypothetical protein
MPLRGLVLQNPRRESRESRDDVAEPGWDKDCGPA